MLDYFGMTLEQLFAVKDKQAWLAFERGELREQDMRARYFADGRALDLEGLRACMRAHYRLLPGVEELLAALRAAGVEMHALSNYPVWFEMIEARLGLSRYLNWSFVSCRTGVRKPDPEAFLGAARALGVAPARCLFVDDREKNCAGARAVGMPAHRFDGAEGLRAELRRRGLLGHEM